MKHKKNIYFPRNLETYNMQNTPKEKFYFVNLHNYLKMQPSMNNVFNVYFILHT